MEIKVGMIKANPKNMCEALNPYIHCDSPPSSENTHPTIEYEVN